MGLQVYCFNAAPRAGKDLSANYLQAQVDIGAVREFKTKLFEAAANFLSISVEGFLEDYDKTFEEFYGVPSKVFEWYKDVPIYEVNGIKYSKRTILQHVSENVLKPLFGEDVMGVALANSLPDDGYVFVSDSGFVAEIIPVIDAVGRENVYVVQILKDGCDFAGDTRRLLIESDFEDHNRPNFVTVVNNGTIEDLLGELDKLIK